MILLQNQLMQSLKIPRILAMALTFNLRTFRQLKAFLVLACFGIILAISAFMIAELLSMTVQTKNLVMMESHRNLEESYKEIEKTARLMHHLNSSVSNLARALSSFLNGTQLSFVEIETKIAPTLFLTMSIIPQLSQISYIGLDGLLFSYYRDNDRTLAVYCNISHSSSWYTKPVNRDTGKLYGDAVVSDSMLEANASWLQMAINSTSSYSSIGPRWHKDQHNLFLTTAAMDGRGVLSLGFPLEIVINPFEALDFHGGYLFLGTVYGQVIMQSEAVDTQIHVHNGSVWAKFGKSVDQNYQFCCSVGKVSEPIMGSIVSNYKFFCSTLDIAGVQSVYVLQYPTNGYEKLVQRKSRTSIILLVVVLLLIVVSFGIYIILTTRATNREMFLCAALIKQTEATQQAERKSMNKTKAYAGANHDVRGSLAAITGLIELCLEDVKPNSELASYLSQMQNCTKDLLGILNSVLDMSKIEAGKASLELEDFNLGQLLEEVVDMYYPLGMKKEVDIVLDPCDGSILKLPLVRGDRLKLKQILCNLLSNAIKFTSNGNISVRAVVKRNNLKKEIIASNRTPALKIFSRFFHRNEDTFTDLDAFHAVKENPNEMEIEFEVDDTGKGIPRDKQLSIFEDYVQVKETSIGQEGCGLGLGIVQSLVRLMNGELRIVEKEAGERGTCFRFNIFLSTCGSEPIDMEENRSSAGFQHFPFMSPKPEGSHIIMFIGGEERRKILKKYLESLNIKVTIINPGRNLRLQVEKIKRRLDLSNLSTAKAADSAISVDYLCASASTNSEPGGNSKIKDGADYILPQYRNRNPSGIILFVIDPNAAASCCSEFDSILASFRKEMQTSSCRFVWLDDQIVRQARNQQWYQETDYVIYKPFHGSRLIQVLSLLPERRGVLPYNSSKCAIGSTSEDRNSVDMHKPVEKHIDTDTDIDKPLSGKRILVVEDVELLRKIIAKHLEKLGAEVYHCENGEEALNQVCKALRDWKKEGDSKSFPYDYIFMDCEMPVMDGYKATKLIRMEEKQYDIHIPIIALTAHAMTEQASKSIDAGMDFHLNKPLQVDKMLDVIRSIEEQ